VVYVAVSVVSTHIEETHKRWKLEAHLSEGQTALAVHDPRFPLEQRRDLSDVTWIKEGYRLLPNAVGRPEAAFDDVSSFNGLMVVIDLDTGREVWRSRWDRLLATPSGFCFDGTTMYVADLEGSAVLEIDMREVPGRLVRRLSHPALNDVHAVTRTSRGLLIASTGTDMVIEVGLDGTPLYEWWAGDYGFTTTIGGLHRPPDPTAEHRNRYYHTRYQTTHLNAARYRDPEETELLVLLWHQGTLVSIDTTAPAGKQYPRPVLDGLTHPHSLRPLPDGGWTIADSQGKRIVVLDRELRLVDQIPSVDGWIQDALPLPDGRVLVADVNRFRLLLQDTAGHPYREYPVDRNWRVYGLEVVPDAVVTALQRESTPEIVVETRLPQGAPAGDMISSP
jgi:hypothetical protein